MKLETRETPSEKANTITVSAPGTRESQAVQNPPDNSVVATLIVPSASKDSEGNTLGPLSPTLPLPSSSATPAATPVSPARNKASAAGSTSGPQLHAPSVASHTRKGSSRYRVARGLLEAMEPLEHRVKWTHSLWRKSWLNTRRSTREDQLQVQYSECPVLELIAGRRESRPL